jgi:hypothetical protein
MVNSKPKTGDTVVPNHVKCVKDIYMTKLGSLGAYTCVDNAWPRLSIAPPRAEEPDAGASGDEDNEPIEFDPGNVSPTPILPASGHRNKKSKETVKCQRQQTSSQTSSRADQREMISDFFSGCTCEERDRIKFQQQSQLTSLAHEFESGQMKDQRISELQEKLDKRHDELHEACLKILQLQQALNLRDLSIDPKVLENLVHASNNLGLPLPPVHQDSDHHLSAKCVRLDPSSLKWESLSPAPLFFPPSQLSVKRETRSPNFANSCQLQHSPLPTCVKHKSLPGVIACNSEVIEILDSDDDKSTSSMPSFDTTNLQPQQANKAPTCHGSAGTPLGTRAIGQDSGLEESRKTICT